MSKITNMAGEMEIDKKTKHLKVDDVTIDILLPMMLKNIESASTLNEEDFYLLDSLIKCRLILAHIDIDDEYSVNVDNLLKYCKQKHNEERPYSYTYVSLTHNNVDTLIHWITEKNDKSGKLKYEEEEVLRNLFDTKERFYDNKTDELEWRKAIQEIEKMKIKYLND